MLYTHCHSHALNLAVCTKSPQRNNRLEEIRKTTKNEAKNVHSFCPTRWTVRGETLDSITNNYEQLMSLWEWSLQKLTNTEMKARIHGAISYMKKSDFFLVVYRLEATILNQTETSVMFYRNLHCLLLKLMIYP